MEDLHFERYEYKYVVPESATESLRRFLRPYTRLDEHAARSPDRRYTIRSLYFDTPRLDLYRASVEDEIDRFKLRIRWYDEAARGPFFCEVKRKIRQVVIKDRARIGRGEFEEVVAGRDVALDDPISRNYLDAFQDRATKTGAVPTLLSRYTREAYESTFGDYARATFDRAMCFQLVDGAPFREDQDAWTYIDGAWSMHGVESAMLLELKFTSQFPRWMADLVAEFDLERSSYSKFASALTYHLHGELGVAHGDAAEIVCER